LREKNAYQHEETGQKEINGTDRGEVQRARFDVASQVGIGPDQAKSDDCRGKQACDAEQAGDHFTTFVCGLQVTHVSGRKPKCPGDGRAQGIEKNGVAIFLNEHAGFSLKKKTGPSQVAHCLNLNGHFKARRRWVRLELSLDGIGKLDQI
jgi:hypothetical protein